MSKSSLSKEKESEVSDVSEHSESEDYEEEYILSWKEKQLDKNRKFMSIYSEEIDLIEKQKDFDTQINFLNKAPADFITKQLKKSIRPASISRAKPSHLSVGIY